MSLPDFDIRYTYITDSIYLRKWLSSQKDLHWFPFSEGKEVEEAVASWMAFSRYGASLTATIDKTPCAMGTLFLMPYQKVRHQCIFKLIVDPPHRRRGIGTSLVKNLKHLAKTYFHLELIHIEVFEGNPLIPILHHCGFTEFARQERFVKEEGRYLTRILLESNL
jgi:RimJ/RimL family protein N-acetyltransferase